MSLVAAIALSEADKLDTLRRLDQFRKWRSLDDKRYCLSCGNIVTGRDVQIIGGTHRAGPLRAICPTERCNSIPMDWALPTDEVLSRLPNRTIDPLAANS
jgi:hypothetical protein